MAELSPVCAVVGGVLGQEIVKVILELLSVHSEKVWYNVRFSLIVKLLY